MVDVRYTPGDAGAWRIAVTGTTLAVLPPEVTAQTADAVWRRLDGGGIGALIEALTGAFGTSLTAIPPFALIAVEDDGVRIAVRGDTEIIVETDAGAESVGSSGAATWAERVIPRARVVTVALAGEADPAAALPVQSGVVPAAAVTLTIAGAARPVRSAPASRPIPVVPDVAASAVDPIPGPPEPALPSRPEPPLSPPEVPEAPQPPSEPAVPEPMPSRPEPIEPPFPSSPEPSVPSHPEPISAETLAPETIGVAGVTTTAVPSDSDASMADDGGDWASTILRSVPPVPPVSAASAAPPAPVLGDHDGATISVAEARRLAALGRTGADAPSPAFTPIVDVPARTPASGRVRLSTGRVVELERAVIVGRRPRSTRTSGDDLPTLVAVESPQHDISRSHVEIRAEGEHVIVTDLATTNGTVLLRAGAEPVRLHPNEPTMVVDGDVLDIGDGVTLTFEDLP